MKINMKKYTFLILLLLFSFFGYSQDIALKRQFSVDAAFVGLGITYEQPLSENILVEGSAGIGSSVYVGASSINIQFLEFSPYTRLEFRRFYNRDNRLRKGKEINDNRGSFIGIQNKIMYNANSGRVMFNEIHWGVQTEIAKKMLLTFHIGLGHGMNLQTKDYIFFPTLGLRAKYILF